MNRGPTTVAVMDMISYEGSVDEVQNESFVFQYIIDGDPKTMRLRRVNRKTNQL